MNWIRENRTSAIVLGLLVLILAAPFVLRPKEGRIGKDTERVVIITPHNETIRSEFGAAFTRHMLEVHGRDVVVDWRTPGGTSEIGKIINGEYFAAFEAEWRKKKYSEKWDDVAGAFNNRKLKMPEVGEAMNTGQKARQRFLESNTGIGVDLFWGGGPYDFQVHSDQGHLVAASADGKYGIAPLLNEKPEWFTEDVIPSALSGEVFRDSELRWMGSCLSSFGICYNVESLERLGITEAPSEWEDLADPRYFGEIALADPNKSGSVTKTFEMVLQEQLRKAYDAANAAGPRDGQTREEMEAEALADGWEKGMQLIQKITANARYFTDSSTKIPLDVAQGDAAVGMCVDFYGRTYNEIHKEIGGDSRIQFVMPVGGSSINADPIGMLRGAPNPELAHAFIRFVLSREGQALWNFKPGTEGGPEKTAIRRLPIRKDMYGPKEIAKFSDPLERPYDTADKFLYEPDWTGRAFNSIRFIIRNMAIDSHHEQQAAWKALIDEGHPARASEVFSDMSLVGYDKAVGDFAAILSSGSKREQVETARSLGSMFRSQYEDALRMVQEGK